MRMQRPTSPRFKMVLEKEESICGIQSAFGILDVRPRFNTAGAGFAGMTAGRLFLVLALAAMVGREL